MKQRKKSTAPLKTSLVPEKHLSERRSLTDPVRPFDANEPEVPVATSPAQAVLHTPGHPLDADTRAFMEPRFGHDFSKVRIHADGGAATSARAINATAYTIGQDIVFDSGQYTPETDTGKHLLAHELAHVVQQSRGGTIAPPPLPAHPLEQAAQHAASTIVQGGTASVAGASAPGIARQPRSLNETLNPAAMSDAELNQEIALIRQWLDENPASSPERDQLTLALSAMEAEVTRRNQQQNQANAGAEQPSDRDAGTADASVPVPADTSTSSADAGTQGETATLSGGPELSTGEQPATFQVGGLPAFRYSAPNVPIATAHIETPAASFDVSLLLRGSLVVTFQHSLRGVSTDVDQGAFRVEANRAVGGIFQGVRVNGINGEQISFGTTVGTEFSQAEVRFIPPNTMAFIGQVRVIKTGDTPVGPLTVQGQPGFELRVTVTPHPPQFAPEPVDEESWFSQHTGPLAVIGVIGLVIAAVALAPETGGGSLLLLAGA